MPRSSLQKGSIDELLATLNANQRRAVDWQGKPLLVLAGPGSGKTLVLTLRVAELLRKSKGKRFKVLGLTFTNKAATEMRERVEDLVPEAADRTLLTTFHSFAADILRQHGSHVSISPDFTILAQEADREDVLRDVIRELVKQGQDVNESDLALLPLITNLLDKLVSDDQVEKRIRDKELGEKLGLLYKAYKRQLISHNQLDYPSLVSMAYQLLTTNPRIADHIRIVYGSICVDEFQDTNLAQYLFLKAIVGRSPSDLFVVADDDQIVFQWNGASPERLFELKQDYEMAVVQLPENYRCPERVIELANNLIRFNVDRSPDKKPLTAARHNGSKDVIRLKNFQDVDNELSWVAADLKSKPAEYLSNSVILGRTRALLERTAKTLNDADVAAALTIRKAEFESAPLRWLHAMLRLANARGDREQLRRVCKAFYELEGIDLRVSDVVAASSAAGSDLLRAWTDEALARRELEPYSKDFLTFTKKTLLERLDFVAFIDKAFKWFGKIQGEPPGSAREAFTDFAEEKQVWNELTEGIVRRFGRSEVTLNVLLHELDLSPKHLPIPPNAVRCLTIHMAKGMEFDHVYLIGLADEVLPSFQSIRKGENSREMQEERRSCFVAITRTCTDLTMTYSDTYFGYAKKPSRFLKEMGLIH
jgi:DNA helicase II / ATP-dependent DNA helicase PcrA